MRLVLVASLVVAGVAVAAPMFGVDGRIVLTMPSYSGFDKEYDVESGLGGGIRVGGIAKFAVNDKLSMLGRIGYLYSTWGLEGKYENIDEYEEYRENINVDMTTSFLSLGGVAEYTVAPQVSLTAGLGIDIPLSAEYDATDSYSVSSDGYDDSEKNSASGDIDDVPDSFLKIDGPNTVLYLEGGAAYQVSPRISMYAEYRLPLMDYMELKTESLGSGSLHQLQVGVSYLFGEAR